MGAYLTNETNKLAERRNDAIHAPCNALPGFHDFDIKPISFFRNPRARALTGKDILSEFACYERTQVSCDSTLLTFGLQ
jgi:hypothetical protein